jgi:hypothetical protein
MGRYARPRSLIISAASVLLGCAAPSQARAYSDDSAALRVMTYNVNEGSDYVELTQATTEQQFLVAVGQTISAVRASGPPARMQAVARQIATARPTLMSLQEVDRWSSGPFNPATGTCGPMAVEFDMLRDLLQALAAQGTGYGVAATAVQYVFPPTPGLILPSTFLCVQVSNLNVILVRTDLPPSRFGWSNPQSGTFASSVVLQTPIGPVPLPRVWLSIDARFDDQTVRFVGTHLESFDPDVRRQQALELRTTLAQTSLPIVVAMDANAAAAPPPVDPTYSDFVAAGYRDAWTGSDDRLDVDPGFTCCQPSLTNPISGLSQRIDLILLRGPLHSREAALVGDTPASMTPEGVWPSDHAGVVAQLRIDEGGGSQ